MGKSTRVSILSLSMSVNISHATMFLSTCISTCIYIYITHVPLFTLYQSPIVFAFLLRSKLVWLVHNLISITSFFLDDTIKTLCSVFARSIIFAYFVSFANNSPKLYKISCCAGHFPLCCLVSLRSK